MRSRKVFEAQLDSLERCGRMSESKNWQQVENGRTEGEAVRADLLEWFDETQAALATLAMAHAKAEGRK